MENEIKRLLIEIESNQEKILELEQYGESDIIELGLKNKLYQSLIKIFTPMEINGKIKIYFDVFSTDFLSIIQTAYDTEEEKQRDFDTYGDSSSNYVIPKEVKQAFLQAFYSMDYEMIKKIKIKDSHARRISGIGHPIRNPNDVIYYAEPACLATCMDLFYKNIQTTMNDTEGVIEDKGVNKGLDGICKVSCNYDSLSEENKKIAEEMISCGNARTLMDGSIHTLSIYVPCHREETIGEVSERLQQLASKLEYQDILFGKDTIENVYEMYKNVIQRNSYIREKYFQNGVTIEGLIAVSNVYGCEMFYDAEENVLWDFPEYYQKHQEYLTRKLTRKDF